MRIGLEGPGKPVVFALLCFMAMLLWGSAAKLAPAFETWRGLWAPLVAVVAFLLGRYTVPRSQRLYERAKFLHETAFAGDWRKPRSAEELRDAVENPRLLQAQLLYAEAASIQRRLRDEAESVAEQHPHARNLIAIQCQLSLLHLMLGEHASARELAERAVAAARELLAASNDTGNRTILADATASAELVDQVLAAHAVQEVAP
jgi:hypothetical protein